MLAKLYASCGEPLEKRCPLRSAPTHIILLACAALLLQTTTVGPAFVLIYSRSHVVECACSFYDTVIAGSPTVSMATNLPTKIGSTSTTTSDDTFARLNNLFQRLGHRPAKFHVISRTSYYAEIEDLDPLTQQLLDDFKVGEPLVSKLKRGCRSVRGHRDAKEALARSLVEVLELAAAAEKHESGANRKQGNGEKTKQKKTRKKRQQQQRDDDTVDGNEEADGQQSMPQRKRKRQDHLEQHAEGGNATSAQVGTQGI
ncbi:hypothetical protein AC578_7756 [Pseudocercospora eumusae]|uniref:Uncharacterized protein n=1 Tax=Pseudocercospora eumusae TaxID=321146 RepID=A0A139H0Y4_9PEZI|nr:hypothetical protein AC578_7756 [Pseudocercospora eumusae]